MITHSIPNTLTYLRIFLIPLILYMLSINLPLQATVLTAFAFLTDYLDGKLARKLHAVSKSGAILDPIADKTITIALLAYFTLGNPELLLFFIIATTRDVLQLCAIPVLMLWKKIPFKVQPKLPARTATALKFAILTLLFLQLLGANTSTYLHYCIYASISLELYILITFIPRFYQIYHGRHDTFV